MKIRSLFILGLLAVDTTAFAQQNLKIGYTNVDYIYIVPIFLRLSQIGMGKSEVLYKKGGTVCLIRFPN